LLFNGNNSFLTPPGKHPYAIRMKSREPFLFAGLWDHWTAPDGSELETCALS